MKKNYPINLYALLFVTTMQTSDFKAKRLNPETGSEQLNLTLKAFRLKANTNFSLIEVDWNAKRKAELTKKLNEYPQEEIDSAKIAFNAELHHLSKGNQYGIMPLSLRTRAAIAKAKKALGGEYLFVSKDNQEPYPEPFSEQEQTRVKDFSLGLITPTNPKDVSPAAGDDQLFKVFLDIQENEIHGAVANIMLSFGELARVVNQHNFDPKTIKYLCAGGYWIPRIGRFFVKETENGNAEVICINPGNKYTMVVGQKGRKPHASLGFILEQ